MATMTEDAVVKTPHVVGAAMPATQSTKQLENKWTGSIGSM
jgi:hypothetical protein